MSLCETNKRPTLGTIVQHDRGLTFLEVLVAVTIVLIIMSGVTLAFIELLRSHDQAQARIDATANARNAVETLSIELKRARNTSNTVGLLTFQGQTTSVSLEGDRINNDRDATPPDTLIDEEDLDGMRNPPAAWVPGDDLHVGIPATTGTVFERPIYVGSADLDDQQIDVDLKNTSASLDFATFDVPGGDPVQRRARFYIGTDLDGAPNTLMREISGVDPVTSTVVSTTGPLCHNVVSFGLLFWDHTRARAQSDLGTSTGATSINPWLTEWPPAAPATASPVTVYITISVYAGTPIPLGELPGGSEIDTVRLTSAVNIESVLADPNFISAKVPVTGP